MKNMRKHLFSFGASCVLALSMALAQDQAPQAPAAQAPAAAQPPNGTMPAQQRQTAQPMRRNARPSFPRMSNSPAQPSAAPAQPSVVAPADSPTGKEGDEAKPKTSTPSLKFDNAPTDIILQAYAQETGKTLLIAPDAPKANITLRSQPDVELTKEEYIEAIEVVLSMNGIVLEPFGEKFVKVFARKTVRTDGIKILMDSPEHGHPEKTRVVSQMIQLKSITVAEAQKALEGFKKPDGLFQTFERTNSILVTDTQENVNRMLEIVKFIDQPLLVLEEVNVRSIRFAKAEDIKKRLEEIVAESQKQTQAKEEIKANVSGAPGFSRTTGRPLPPGLTRLGSQVQAPVASTPNEILQTLVSDADRGMIRGKVQILADERSNQLIIVTRADNMAFFDKIITVLDVETAPDVKVEVQRLEFADAEEVSTMLNDLIGNATSKKDEKKPTGAAKGTGTPNTPGEAPKSMTLAETLAARAASRTETTASEPGKSKLGQLSKDNIKILADKRTNALVMMGSPNDLLAIKEIIKGMDIQLSQVLIETVVLQVGLNSSISTGIDWVKRVKPITEPRSVLTGYDETTGAPIYQLQDGLRDSSYRYGVGGGGGSKVAQNLWDIGTNMVTFGGSGLEYMATIKNLRLDAVVSASKTDGSSRILSSPVLLTVDNKEATLESKEMRYMFKGMRYMGYSSYGSNSGGYEPDVEQREIGLTVKITPRINPSGNVMLTIEETFEDVGPYQEIPGQSGGAPQKWPTVVTRKLSADVSVSNGETVILGGLVKNDKTNSEAGIPILKDIPYVGKYLFGKTSADDNRSELLVFLTPYVINSAQDMNREARRRKDYINATDIWTKGWSDSKLADPVPASEMKQRLERKKEIEKAWTQYRKDLKDHHEIDDSIIDERTQTEAVIDATASANFAKEQAVIAATTNAPVGTLRVSETVEVLKPRAAPDGALLKDAADPAPKDDKRETPAGKWWKLW